LQRQVDKRLAVAPAMSLKSAIEAQSQNRTAQQRLATGERQLGLETQRQDLATEKQAFDQGQLPWATAGGALSAGVQLYGGYRAIEDANAVKARLDTRDALEQKFLEEQRGQNATLLDILQRQQDTWNKSAQPSPFRNLRWAMPMAMRPPSQWTLQP